MDLLALPSAFLGAVEDHRAAATALAWTLGLKFADRLVIALLDMVIVDKYTLADAVTLLFLESGPTTAILSRGNGDQRSSGDLHLLLAYLIRIPRHSFALRCT